ncbi:hypothetical protein [Levilactobacillus bambusae]|uniref:Uncharacterized protein n=1 Tax=Levilactobacillus bambusae TaxID=2024736 RepID=A0A2V1N271_9LACO|nr:hypothetical protein [Levilactobacillus bambusae]PWG01072.1 hypothetical protein DCM90_02550 [Levilactobacillus bambusae]
MDLSRLTTRKLKGLEWMVFSVRCDSETVSAYIQWQVFIHSDGLDAYLIEAVHEAHNIDYIKALSDELKKRQH